MIPADRAKLTAALRNHVARVAEDLRTQVRTCAAVRQRALQLHADEQVGEDFEVWTDLLARRGAVLWVLKSVYVRVLEDRGLLQPGRLLDREAQELFERLAPNLGETAFLRWIYRDLASARGGLPELFGRQPAELAWPADARSRELLACWRHRDPDTGAQWSFAEETFEGELMGDLYQELDPVVQERFALCQTPDFVRAFLLDRTLTPAIAEFGAETVRLLDPACGSGHFLIDGLKRLVAATAAARPEWTRRQVVGDCLERVVGIDLNDYACALARARLVMTAAELAADQEGTTKHTKSTKDGRGLAGAAAFHPHVYWADGLEQVEQREEARGLQLDLLDASRNEVPRASMTRPEVRVALAEVLKHGFQAVVANPPYILERDEARKTYHRELLNRKRRYVSATGKYSLASPFTERCFQLAQRGGFVGLITSNNFLKREFGKALIEQVLAGLDLTLIVDTSQAYIPFHGTPTVLIFGRNRRPSGELVRVVMSKRGESGTPDDPARGRVWTSIVEGWHRPGFENEYVSVADLQCETFGKHPWSLGGGGATELKDQIEKKVQTKLNTVASSIGYTTICGDDPVFLGNEAEHQRARASAISIPLVAGEALRDWSFNFGDFVLFPYESLTGNAISSTHPVVEKAFWRYRQLLRNRVIFQQTLEEKGMSWYEHMYRDAQKLRTPLSIAFAFVATHNHFVLDRGGKVFNRSAPVIKLPAEATEDDHLALLGLLNSSTACFWMKQVFHNKGIRGQGGGLTVTDWEQFYEFDATKMKLFPVIPASEQVLPYARRIDELAQARVQRSIPFVLSVLFVVNSAARPTAHALREALTARRAADLADFQHMVAQQEELDWLCYQLYGLDPVSDVVPPDQVEPLLPTWLPWCLAFARRDAAHRAALARGEEPGELPTAWFERHRWEPCTELPTSCSAATRARIAARLARTQANPALALIECANFKRRWYRPDHEAEERDALTTWLADRVEASARLRGQTFTIEQLAAALQDDLQVLAVCEVLTGRPDFSLSQLVGDTLRAEAVPNHPLHRYKPAGLTKRAIWERTWEDQRREDAGEPVTPAVPPAYGSGDFLKPEYWKLRGKLDVPKERFIAFTEVPGREPGDTLYGWAGWTPLQRQKATLALDEQLEDNGVPLADRIALLDSAWRLLPEVAREDPAAASRLKAELQALTGLDGPSPEMLADWRQRFPPPTGRSSQGRRPVASRVDEDGRAGEDD